MDLYEALKQGADPAKLKKDFAKELDEAFARIEKEKAAEAAAAAAQKAKDEEREREIKYTREDLIDEFMYYTSLLFGIENTEEEDEKLYKELENTLKEFEKGVTSLLKTMNAEDFNRLSLFSLGLLK